MKNRTLTWLVLLGSACAAYPARRPTSSSTAEAATESRPPTATPIQANTTPAVAAEPPPRTTASAPTAPSDSKFSIPGPSASSPDNNGSSSALVDQGSVADRQITQDVRRALMDDPALASAAKSVKITTNNGKVTLRGSVKSEKERAAVEAAAKKNAGGGQVENLLEVSP